MNTVYIINELRKRGYNVPEHATQSEVSALVQQAYTQPQHHAAETGVVIHMLADLLRNSFVTELCIEKPCQQQT